jgi:hypothetical protein
MDRQLALKHLAQAERHVTEGRATIQRQQQIIVVLESDGHDAAQAHALLETFLVTLALHEQEVVRIRSALGLDAG